MYIPIYFCFLLNSGWFTNLYEPIGPYFLINVCKIQNYCHDCTTKRSNFKHYSKSCCILVSLNKIPRPAQHKFCGTYTHFKFTVISYQSQPTIQIWLSQSDFLDLQHHSYIHILMVLSGSIKTLQQIKFKHCYVLTCCIPVSSNKNQELHNTNLVGDV